MLQGGGIVKSVVVVSALFTMVGAPSIRTVSAAAGGASDDGYVRVLRETPVSPSAEIPQNVREECHTMGKEMPNAIVRSSRRVKLVQDPKTLSEKSGKYLSIEITQAKAKGGGAFTGPKKMIVRGSLIENGKEVANFDAERGSMKAASTCSTLQKAEKELGGDIGKWLEHPKPNAHLGD